MVTFTEVKNNEEIKTYIRMADETLKSLKFTEHSFAHVVRCADVAGQILSRLGYDRRTVELGQIAAYMHDIGNVVNRIDHAQSGAVMAFQLLDKMGMLPNEIAKIVCAIGNHDESTAYPVNELAAALIIADKSDVRRSRVRDKADLDIDIHDRVHYAVEKSKLTIDPEEGKFTLSLAVDENISPISEYFEIFLGRMLLCRRAADYFNMKFEVTINSFKVM